MKDAKKYKAIFYMNCRIGCRSSESFLVDESTPLEPWGKPALEDRDTSSSSHELPMESRAKVEPGLGQHSVVTHFPKGPQLRCLPEDENNEASCRRRANAVVPRAEHFGDLTAAEHKILSESSESRDNHRHAVVVQDLATQWLQSYPCKSKNSQETQKSLMKFLEATRKPTVIYTDNSLEFGKSCEELSWNHCTSTPLRSETNGIAERAVRRVEKGTSGVLLQSGLGNEWWADSMECYCYLRNIQVFLSDGKSPYERQFGMPFNGPVTPFGAMVEYHPISTKDRPRPHQSGAKVLPGIFLGYALYAERIWRRDILVADIEELRRMDASEIHERRLNAKGSVNDNEW